MKNRNPLLLIYTLMISLLIMGCNKDSAQINPNLPISRLLVSSANTTSNATSLTMFSPADGENLGSPITFNMVNPTGNGVVYDNEMNLGFQIGMLNKTIRTFSINTDGTLRILNSFRDSMLMDGRGIAYNRAANQLYVASSKDSLIRIYRNASNKTGNSIAEGSIPLDFQPWGIFFNAGKLVVVADLEVKKIIVIDDIGSSSATFTYSEVTIPTANRLHGITYSSKKDVLLLTDIGNEASNSDGAVYIFENIITQLIDGGTINPTRTISGAATALGNPVDVTVDDREGKDIIYIAEKANSKILGFKLTDNGNTAPYLNTTVNTPPESVWVDAR